MSKAMSKAMSKGITKIDLFKELSGCDETGISRFVCVEEYKDKYITLKTNNGGGWCRLDGTFGNKYKIMTVNNNKETRYSWEKSEEEKKNLKEELDNYFKNNNINDNGSSNKGNNIFLIKMCGLQEKQGKGNISKKIKDYFKNKSCVVCGNSNKVEIDHKNGLYNDKRVLNSKTQTIDDFQVLCRHCNLQKRQTIKWTKKHNKRYRATKIPQMKPFDIDFTVGDETYDKDNINAMVGTYWYDPVDFMEKISLKLKTIKI
jgi:5-methylcytosine-specific restriction endonuclease McrA